MPYEPNERIYCQIKDICLRGYDRKITDPFKLVQEIWDIPGFPMHCPEHHVVVPTVLLTVFRILKGDSRMQLEDDLDKADERGRNLLPGFCGFYGACGAGIGGGIFFSLLTDTTPLSVKTWELANRLTSECLGSIASLGGPRCCKRVSYTTFETALAFMNDSLGLNTGLYSAIKCGYHEMNRECLRKSCPYYPGAANG